ncbi:VPS10 domain-containing protein [Aureispira anguillae]|uniref:T9SS type A sorting domain-containing protein n=1 Tax=Aureispira anguillae TaxID=2864201 RepID=A0A915YKZ2_9BACT|nr:T9SS type A sorting domain-containing protein [Aureispira anguillae]BDS14872.1 T9SS type A sorting domain-containing protein [Aureispira anguillae]
MKTFTVLPLIFLFFASHSLWGQDTWQKMIHDPNANFYDIQQAYENELGNVPYQRGLGIKQYKRWEYYWEKRVDEKGRFPASGHVLNEMENYYATHSNSRNYIVGSGNWTLLGPTPVPNNGTGQLNGNGRLNCITFHPTDANTVYVGAPAGGVWRTTDNGATWTQFITGLTRLGVSSIVIHPTTPNTMYIGTGDRDGGDVPGYGVWRSTDGGLTWNSHNTGMGNRTINELLMDPTNPNIMVAASSNGFVYRTIDGGANWTPSTFLGFNPKDIAYHPTNSSIVYASGDEFHRSTDGGATWTQIVSGVPAAVQRIALAVSPNQPDWVYLLAGDGNGLVGIYRSTNSGVSFSTRTTVPNILGYETNGSGNASQAWYDLVIVADPTDANTIFTGGVNLWKSTDGGATMNCVSYWVGPSGGIDGVHADQHALEFSPHNNNLYNGNDGGLYFTVDGGTNWTDLSDGLVIAQLYKLGISQQTLDRAINGYQDNGTAVSTGTVFSTEIGGDGMECIIDPTDDTYMYGALYYGDIRRSTNGGTTFGSITGSIGEQGGWVTPYKLDPNNANRMFAGYDNIWRNDAVRAGTAWTQISNFGGTQNIVDIAIAPSNSDVVYASRSNNTFYRSNNATAGAPAWTDLTANLPVANEPADIEIDPTDPTHLFVAIGSNIYESTNSGANWVDVSGSLPNISLNTIIIDSDSPVDAMYVGMDVGVYYKDNSLADWVAYSTGIPNVEVTELEIHYNAAECKSMIYAATYGQGLWKSDLKDPGVVAAVACFEASLTNVCMGEPVTFTDQSSYTPTSWVWSITPATFTFVGGTNANSQNPQISFTAAGTYNIQLTAGNATGNDIETKNSYITVSAATVASAFNEDFEGEPLCGTANDCGATTCPLTGVLWTNLTNGTDDNIDWRVDENGTASAGTGPSVDFNPGTTAGNYAYLEASSGCDGQTAILQSSCMMLDQNYNFVFGHHLLGTNIGSLHLDINVNGVWTLDIIPAIVGNQGNSWQTSTANLTAYTGQTIKLRIRGITGNGFESDIAIDDIRLVPIVLLSTQLESFSAECLGTGSNLLNWKMSDDQFTGNFSVEKYIQEQWVSIATLNSKAQGVSYEFADPNPFLGENLYRLAILNQNGTKIYSNATVTNCEIDVYSFVVFPNPFKDEISLQFHSEIAASLPFRITNLLGQNLIQGNVKAVRGLNTFTLPMSDLPQGVYLLHTEGKMIKLVKN